MLCGKSLSRIWAGNGEDFCSREHRNQYRLRRGMDRLLEANKVANVMRRRENPRQIPTASLRSKGPASQRGFFDPQLPRDLQPRGSALRSIGPALQNRLEQSQRFVAPPANRGREQAGRAIDSNPLRCVGQRAVPPAVAFAMPAHIVEAPPSDVARAMSETPCIRVAPALPWHGGPPSTINNMPQPLSSFAAAALESAPPAQSAGSACPGRALRVSLAAGFRVPDCSVESRLGLPEIPGMVWPGMQSLGRHGAAGQSSPTSFAIHFGEPPACLPDAPTANFERRFEWPGIMQIRVQFVECAKVQWTASAPFGCPDDSIPKERR
jgi:hypothetical protein